MVESDGYVDTITTVPGTHWINTESIQLKQKQNIVRALIMSVHYNRCVPEAGGVQVLVLSCPALKEALGFLLV